MTRTLVLLLTLLSTTCFGQVTINGPNSLEVKEADLFHVEGLTIEEFKSCVVYVRPDTDKPQVLVLQTINNLPVLYVKGMKPGRFEIVLGIFIPEKYEVVFHELVIGEGEVIPDPDPLPVGKYNIAIIFEREDLDNYSKEHQQIISSIVIHEKMEKLGHTIVEGGIVDKDIVGPDGEVPDDLEPYLDKAKGKRMPVIVLSNNSGIVGYTIPGSEAKLMELLGGAK